MHYTDFYIYTHIHIYLLGRELLWGGDRKTTKTDAETNNTA